MNAIARLKKRWAVFSVAGFLALSGLFLVLLLLWEPRFAIGWGITAVLGFSYLSWILWHNLPKNHRPGKVDLLPSLGPGNALTLMRGVLLAFLAGFLFLPQPGYPLAWVPALIFTLVIAADFFDGYLARVSNHVTRLGEALDMRLDGIGISIAILLAIQYGQLPTWYLVVALARYLFLCGLYLRSRFGYPNQELPESVRRRAFAGLQMGFVSVMLWPIFTPPGTFVAAIVFAIPFLGGFLLDWLIVSAIIPSTDSRRFMDARWLVVNGFPVALRLVLMASLILFSWEKFLYYADRISSSIALDIFSPEVFGMINFTLETFIMLLLIFGIAGRLASIAGLLLLGIDQIFGSLQLAQFLLIIIYVSMIYLGTGPYSLWKPEDRLIFNKVGEASRVSVLARSTAEYGD